MVVQSANPSNVDAVVVDGRFLKKDGKLTTVDLAKLSRDAADTIERARQEASKPGAGEGIAACSPRTKGSSRRGIGDKSCRRCPISRHQRL